MYYNSGQGALVIADSRTMLGGDYSRDQKVYEIADKKIVFAASGLSGIAGKLVPAVKEARQNAARFRASEIVTLFEDEMAELHNRYKMTRPFRFGDDDVLLNGIIGIVDDGGPKLHCLYENGYAEMVSDFRAVGHGARHAHNILRSLYESSLSEQAALEIGIHALVEVAKVDAMVDDCMMVFPDADGPNSFERSTVMVSLCPRPSSARSSCGTAERE